MKNIFFLSLKFIASILMLLNANQSACQNIDLQPNNKHFTQNISQPEYRKGDTRIKTPQVPTGYNIRLKGSDCKPVIDLEGNITLPLSEKKVNLLYTLMNPSGKATDVPLSIILPARTTGNANGNAQLNVIPALREWLGGKGYFTLPDIPTIVVDIRSQKELENIPQTIANDIQALTKKTPIIRYGTPHRGDIYLTINADDKSLEKEGYALEIGESIKIKANTATGIFYGSRTVLQLLHQSSQIPQGEARDYPKYEKRGFMLDVGRKFFSIDFLRDYVRFMSYYKMNEFHIHLNDNGFKQFFNNDWDSTYSAFRLESSTYPGLAATDGHYTKAEFIELQKLAEQYHINIVPEIDAPAHTLAFYHYDNTLGSIPYGRDHLELNNLKIYDFMDNLFKEYLKGEEQVFRGPEVHIGTDEYDKRESEKFRHFTDHYIRYVESFGKRARLWGALTHASGSTPVKSENIIMDAWYNGYADPARMIELGYDLISIPDGMVYIVPAAGYYHDYLNNKYLYENWEPNQIGKEIFPMGHPNIIGGKFAVWNDHVGNGISEKDVHHRVVNSMKVLSQKFWGGQESNLKFDEFTKLASAMGEAPGMNIEGIIPSKNELVAHYTFDTQQLIDQSDNKYHIKTDSSLQLTNSTHNKALSLQNGKCLQLPMKEIGYDYTVELIIRREGTNKGTILTQSPNATVWLSTPKRGLLGFSRDGYTFAFNYTVPENEWVKISIMGDSKGTTLYVNDSFVETLEGTIQYFNNGKDKMALIQTLVFPLQSIGSESNIESLDIDDLKIWNKMNYPKHPKKN